MHELEITHDGTHFLCVLKDSTGSPIQGRGVSLIEAVGDWAIHSQAVQIASLDKTCQKLDRYRVDMHPTKLVFSKAPKRD